MSGERTADAERDWATRNALASKIIDGLRDEEHGADDDGCPFCEAIAALNELRGMLTGADDRLVALVARHRDTQEALAEVATGLIEIAEMAMPDSYFATDSRVAAARAALASVRARTP